MGKRGFAFRKDIGFSEIIALAALAISGFALYASLQASKAIVVPGSGAVRLDRVSNSAGDCRYVAIFPFQFHNSGGRAVALERISPPENLLPSVVFVSGNLVLPEDAVSYEMYLSQSETHSVSGDSFARLRAGPEFRPSYDLIGDLIEPGGSRSFEIVLLVDSLASRSRDETMLMLAFDVSFANGQTWPVRQAVRLDASLTQTCE